MVSHEVKPWYLEELEKFNQFQSTASHEYRSLTVGVTNKNKRLLIAGSFPIVLDCHVVDRFLIEIECKDDLNKTLPVVKETAGRIPRIVDRHVDKEGVVCLFLPDERWKYFSVGKNIVDFILGPVHQFFLWQSYYEMTGISPWGYRAHGSKGIIEYYEEEVGTGDQLVITELLSYLTKPQVKGHWPCFCGSMKKMRHCHFAKVIELRKKISPSTAKASLERLRKMA